MAFVLISNLVCCVYEKALLTDLSKNLEGCDYVIVMWGRLKHVCARLCVGVCLYYAVCYKGLISLRCCKQLSAARSQVIEDRRSIIQISNINIKNSD